MKDGKKLDTYRLAMFPLMLQALYNAKVVLRGAVFPDEQGPTATQAEYTYFDVNTVLSAFSSVGVFPRFKIRSSDGAEDDTFTLRHFSILDKEKVQALFSPDQAERDIELIELEEKKDKEKEKIDRNFQNCKRSNKKLRELNTLLVADATAAIEAVVKAQRILADMNEAICNEKDPEKVRCAVAGTIIRSSRLVDSFDFTEFKKHAEESCNARSEKIA